MSRDLPLLPDAAVRLDRLPAAGRELSIAADAGQRAAIAVRLGISAVERLDATITATPFRGGIRVLGRLAATIVQPCVVTLEPVVQEIDEPIDRALLPGPERPVAGPAGAEIFVDLESDELPDRFDDGEADLSALVIETLALAIDPYPRAPGASLEGFAGDAKDEDDNPFVALQSLGAPKAKG